MYPLPPPHTPSPHPPPPHTHTYTHTHTLVHQIVMLESSTDLFHYLQASQITRDLGGTLDYDHDQWIQIQRVGSIFTIPPQHLPTHTRILSVNQFVTCSKKYVQY